MNNNMGPISDVILGVLAREVRNWLARCIISISPATKILSAKTAQEMLDATLVLVVYLL